MVELWPQRMMRAQSALQLNQFSERIKMQRIQPANPDDSASLKATYERITKTRGYVSNILMSFSHAPEGLERFAALGEYVRYGVELSGRVRELAILTIATGNQYAWSHHHPHAIKAGVTQGELDALEKGKFADSLSAAEKAAISYAREFAKGNVGDGTFAELRKHYSDRQITDLTLLAGYFMALGSTISAFRIALEPNFPAKAKAI
jgi:4-carboxymuconolactone decarboxylase